MKRIMSLLLSMLLLMSLCACNKNSTEDISEPEIIELTTENISDYLTINSTLEESTVEASYILGREGWSGESTIKTEIFTQTNAHFENVQLKLRIQIEEDKPSVVPEIYHWEFDDGNKTDETADNFTSRQYKLVDISVPYDGACERTDELRLMIVTFYNLTKGHDPLTASNISVSVEEVSGNVVIG